MLIVGHAIRGTCGGSCAPTRACVVSGGNCRVRESQFAMSSTTYSYKPVGKYLRAVYQTFLSANVKTSPWENLHFSALNHKLRRGSAGVVGYSGLPIVADDSFVLAPGCVWQPGSDVAICTVWMELLEHVGDDTGAMLPTTCKVSICGEL